MIGRQTRRNERVVVVVGASSGTGRAAARAFAARGARLVLAARSLSSLERAAEECRSDGADDVLVVPTDVLDELAVREPIDRAVGRYGRVDVLVHTAMVMAYGRVEDVPAAVFTRVVDTAVHGTANLARSVLPVFRRQGEGTLVVVNSLLGSIVAPLMGSYATGKWGQLGLARVLQIETRDAPGIRVCTVSPGGVDTPIYYQAANYTGRPPIAVDSPEMVARAILRCADGHGRNRTVGAAYRVVLLGFRLAPPLYDVLVTPLLKLAALSRQPMPASEGNVFAGLVPLVRRARSRAR